MQTQVLLTAPVSENHSRDVVTWPVSAPFAEVTISRLLAKKWKEIKACSLICLHVIYILILWRPWKCLTLKIQCLKSGSPRHHTTITASSTDGPGAPNAQLVSEQSDMHWAQARQQGSKALLKNPWYSTRIDKICYTKGHQNISTLDKPQGIVLGWAPIGFAVMATPWPSQCYFGHT